jgi:hypothetical protein
MLIIYILSNYVGGISVVLVVCVVFVRLLVDVVGCCVAWIIVGILSVPGYWTEMYCVSCEVRT